LLKNDIEVAHEAFARGQSADPDYAGAWTGEGTVAMLLGDQKEAWAHYEHAIGIAEADFTPAREEFAKGVFDGLLSGQEARHDTAIVQLVLLSLQQLLALRGPETATEHLAALYRERAGDFGTAAEFLQDICAVLEAEYEETEDIKTLVRFAQAKADLARNLLATRDFTRAAEEAETALSLTDDDDDSTFTGGYAKLKSQLRLSARLTFGLAKFYIDDMDEALAAFKLALNETDSAPDVVCSLAQVLWAIGGKKEKSVAKEQLFEAFSSTAEDESRRTSNISPVLMLGAMAVLENPPDLDTAEAVQDELESIRVQPGLSKQTRDEVRIVLAALEDALLSNNGRELLHEAQKGVMLFPCSPGPWARLADVVSAQGSKAAAGMNAQPLADMVLQLSIRQVTPRGEISADELSNAFARTSRVADAQRAIMVRPGGLIGWTALIEGSKELLGDDSPGGIPLR
jgi:superkiller protein 3